MRRRGHRGLHVVPNRGPPAAMQLAAMARSGRRVDPSLATDMEPTSPGVGVEPNGLSVPDKGLVSHLIFEPRALLQAVVKLPPVTRAVIHVAVDVVLLHLVDWGCRGRARWAACGRECWWESRDGGLAASNRGPQRPSGIFQLPALQFWAARNQWSTRRSQ